MKKADLDEFEGLYVIESFTTESPREFNCSAQNKINKINPKNKKKHQSQSLPTQTVQFELICESLNCVCNCVGRCVG